MALPPLTDIGALPLGVHPARLSEVLDRFGVGSPQRQAEVATIEQWRITRDGSLRGIVEIVPEAL